MPSLTPPSPESKPLSGNLGIDAEALGARLPALLVAAQRIAETVASGMHGRRRVGMGESFWQFRPYQTGDTVDGIDWRQSAKGDRLYIRETEWAAAQTVWLWRDSGVGMNFRSERGLPTKRERAELLLMGLGSLLARGGERIGLLGGGALPSIGKSALHTILSGLKRDVPLVKIDRQAARNSTLILFSDFLDPIEDIARGLDRAAIAGVAGQLVQVLDPTEVGLNFNGRVRFREMAENASSENDALVPRVEAIRDAYCDAMRRQQDDLATLARSRGWEFLVHATDAPAEEPLRVLFTRLATRRIDVTGVPA